MKASKACGGKVSKKYETGGKLTEPPKKKKAESGNGLSFQMSEKTNKRLGKGEECKTGDATPKCKSRTSNTSAAPKAKSTAQRKKQSQDFATKSSGRVKPVNVKPPKPKKMTKDEEQRAKDRRPANPRFL